MKPGPKGLSPEQRIAHGETRPSRAVVSLYPDHASRPDPAEIPPPKGMSKEGRKIWAAKVERCRSASSKPWTFWPKGNTPTMAMVNGHRHYSAEFYDTPASQKVSTNAKPAGNAFARNGRPATGG